MPHLDTQIMIILYKSSKISAKAKAFHSTSYYQQVENFVPFRQDEKSKLI